MNKEIVPYQLCPKCNGQGTVNKPPYVAGDIHEWTSSTATNHQCDVCNGTKVIPMYSLPAKDLKEKLEEIRDEIEDNKMGIIAGADISEYIVEFNNRMDNINSKLDTLIASLES